uniref:Uncharacterized protein n=1 Tax=viral metagenome TaxID=1070528 RepID=A0A6C0J8Y9_9ZZZZ
MRKSLRILYKENILFIEPYKCLELELKLNKSEYRKIWNTLGDVLYAWTGSNYKSLCDYPYHNVPHEQYLWLKENN